MFLMLMHCRHELYGILKLNRRNNHIHKKRLASLEPISQEFQKFPNKLVGAT